MKTFHLFDSGLTKSTYNVKIVTGAVVKHGSNPLFREGNFDMPSLFWEARYDNGYPNVFFDPDKKLYRCYYTSIVLDKVSSETSLAQRAAGAVYKARGSRITALLYAESEDGLVWSKPSLGVTEFMGSRENNVIRLYAHGSCVFWDPHEADCSRRYKMIARDDHFPRKLCTAYSGDGIHFTDLTPIPELAYEMPGDTHNYVYWDDSRMRYILITRMFNRELRTSARSESPDFINWTKPREILKGAGPDDQIYSMTFFKNRDLYFGLPSVFHAGDGALSHHDCIDIQLAYSGDTVNWDRIAPGEHFIPRGRGRYPDGEYDCGCCFASAPVEEGDQLRIYYMGGNGSHYKFRETGLCLAMVHKDRLAGISPVAEELESVYTTILMQLNSSGICLSADIKEGGSIAAALLNQEGTEIEGYGFEQFSYKLLNNGMYELLWNERSLDYVLKEFYLKLRFNGAVLYNIKGDMDIRPIHPV